MGLKPLMLPELVLKARQNGESDTLASSLHSSPNQISHGQQFSSSSTVSMSDEPSPTFSVRGHSRFGSSASSIASSPPLRDSVDGFGAGKRPLTEVKEEPQERSIEDSEMIDDLDEDQELITRLSPRSSKFDWSLDDHHSSPWPEFNSREDSLDNDFAPNPINKRQRANTSPSPFNGLTSRMTSSISRKWRPRKLTPPMPGTPNMSRANSTRAPSFASATLESTKTPGHALPLTPNEGTHGGSSSLNGTFVETQMILSGHDEDPEDQAKPTTPLLPPIMTQIADDIREIPYQSPLQSPSIAEPETPSALNSPLPTPHFNGLPSPPLSSKTSTTSFRRQRGMSAAPLSEISPMLISDPNDPWADILGHANYTIHPEPYKPSQPNMDTCKQLRAHWDIARHNYAKHLMRTGDNYGPTSKIYHLTEDKWAEIDTKWRGIMDACFARAKVNTHESKTSLSKSQEAMSEPPPLIKMPSLNGPKSEGKFPKLGDEGIVGPMEVVAPPVPLQQQPPPSRKKRKLGFFRWVQGVWPVGAGVFGRGPPSGP